MPRHGRLEIPGAVYHIIARGIERNKIYSDDFDRTEFLRRFGNELKEAMAVCLAWALIPNHFHLLVRMGPKPLSGLMRKLMTGYAVYYNKRHKRNGYLFQNRYKSIICQEDSYLLQLIRYIHINPYRAGLVKDLDELDKYPWSGHSALTGYAKTSWYVTNEVLSYFDEKKGAAVRQYREFVADGFDAGKRDDLTGGGFRRSSAGWKHIDAGKIKDNRKGDERILGDSDFVDKILKTSEEEIIKKEKLKQEGWDLKKLTVEVCKLLSVTANDLKKKCKKNNISYAKALIAYWGTSELGVSGSEIARFLDISRPAVSKSVNVGENFAKDRKLEFEKSHKLTS